MNEADEHDKKVKNGPTKYIIQKVTIVFGWYVL